MTSQENFKEKILAEFDDHFYQRTAYKPGSPAGIYLRDFISQALDNQMKLVTECLPKEKPMNVFSFVLKGEELEDYMKSRGWNGYRGKLLDNLKDKGLI